MKTEGIRVSIESLCASVTSGGTPSRGDPSFWDDGVIPWFKTGELRDWYVEEAEERISTKALSQSAAKVLPPNTVLMAMYGDGKTITTLGILRDEAATNQACCAMIADPSKCNFLFLFYALKYHRHELLQLVVAGAQRNLSGGIIRNFKILWFSLPVQHRIANILSAYDELIENNRRRMTLLEESARHLYHEWFVRLRFPGYEHARIVDEVPSGWERLSFSELAEFNNGYPFAPDELGAEGLPIVKIPELRDGVSEKTPRNDGEKIPERHFLRDGELLFSWSGTLHIEFWYDGAALLNQHLFKVEPNGRCSRAFLLFALRQALPEFGNQSVGATMKHIRKSALSTVTVRLPSHALLTQFEEISARVFQQIQNLRHQNQKLRAARDLLLPRLMSAEIVV